jgi:homocitrate synthase
MSAERYAIVDTTLREGEQFVWAYFDTDDKVEIARGLDAFGVEFIEVTNPLASDRSMEDCRRIAGLGLKTKVLTHIRCAKEDADVAIDMGVAGINVFMATSPILRKLSHGKEIPAIIDQAAEVLTYIRSQAPDTLLRFSSEDTFRTPAGEIDRVYKAVTSLGVIDRFGIADTLGLAVPRHVRKLVERLQGIHPLDIEFHGHDDGGCAVANAYGALLAGATHIDTCVLGIGERVGITSLAGLIARLYLHDPKTMAEKYDLQQLVPLHKLMARILGIPVPFNHPIVGEAAFIHKAGVHIKAIQKDPHTYEAINPNDFGLERTLNIASALTGWRAIEHRSEELGLTLDDHAIKEATHRIKTRADKEKLSLQDVDGILNEMASKGWCRRGGDGGAGPGIDKEPAPAKDASRREGEAEQVQ